MISDYPSLQSLFWGSLGRLPRGAIIMILRAYIDESSTHRARRQSEPLILTGCVSTPRDWQWFEERWHALLKKHHLSYMNFDDWANRRVEFDREPEELNRIFQDFGKIAYEHTWFGFHTVLLAEDFARFKGPTNGMDSELSTILESDYGVSLRIAYAFAHIVFPDIPGVTDPSIYVLAESGHRNQGAVQEILTKYRKTYPKEERIIKDARLIDKEECYGVQCADFHGGCVRMAENGSGPLPYTNIMRPIELQKSEDITYPRTRVRWFRLEINHQVLTDLKDAIILSRPKFLQRFRVALSKPLSEFSERRA